MRNPIRATVLLSLSVCFLWAALPARGESGTIYRYATTLPHGQGTGDELLFVSGSRVEVLATQRNGGAGLLTVFEMAGPGPGLSPGVMKVWEVSGDRRAFLGTVESLPGWKTLRIEIFPSGRPAETIAAPVLPWTFSEALSTLNLDLNIRFAEMGDPKTGFMVGLVRPNREPNEPPLRFGPVKFSWMADEERGGAPVRKYRLEGEGLETGGGFVWARRGEEPRIEALELDAGEEPEGFKLQLVSVQPLDSAGWEETKRAQLGTPASTGPVEAAEVRPHPCRVPGLDQEVLCATYPVWENRETRQGRKIGLNIVILPALGPDKQPDPIFEFGGGPGEGIVSLAPWYPETLRRNRDVVLIDQRGTGRSNPLDCSFYGEPVDFRRAAGELFPVDEIRKCRAKLEKIADLTQYTTSIFADDLNEVRQWLGYDKINLSGGSYGTRMAQVYWHRHPETVRSVVLVAVVHPGLYLPLRHAYAGQRALDLLLAECAAQPECHAAYPDVNADLRAIKKRIDKGVTVTVTNTRTGERQEVRPAWGMVAEGIRFLLYGQGGGSLPLQIRRATQGDLAPLIQMAIERRLGIDEALAMGLNFSVTCAEDLPFITEQMIRKNTPGTYLGDYRIRQQKAVCANWPRGKVEKVHEPVRSDVPVLLISGERDPVTPPEQAEKASRYMTNKLHVVIPRGSHGGVGECTDNLIRDFLDRASVEGLDPSCAATALGPVTFMMP